MSDTVRQFFHEAIRGGDPLLWLFGALLALVAFLSARAGLFRTVALFAAVVAAAVGLLAWVNA